MCQAGLTVDDLPAGLDEARDEVVTEQYGAAAFAAQVDAANNSQGRRCRE